MTTSVADREPITLCLTAGGRPDLLERTLASLFAVERSSFSHLIIANDAGDQATSAVARKMCPDATVIQHRFRRGQHATIDEMYRLVETPLIFHCEDDWEFAQAPFIDRCRRALSDNPSATCVCVRDYDPLYETAGAPDVVEGDGYEVHFLKRTEHGSFTFNPGLLRRDLWESAGGYRRFNKEVDIDRHFRDLERRTAYLRPPACVHIGDNRHVIDPFRRRGGRVRDGFRVAKHWMAQSFGINLSHR